MKKFFPITSEAIAHLSKVDAKLGERIAQLGKVRRALFNSPFECLVSCVIAQQISSRVADKIFERVSIASGGINAENILALGIDGVRNCGVSERKASTILSLANAFASGEFSDASLKKMTDSEIEKRLLAFSGIGAWTVEMFLIFALARNDVFSIKDFGVRKGFAMIHPEGEIKEYKKLYSPYGTVASIYFWG